MNIGGDKHIICVPKNVDLREFIRQFLIKNGLKESYQDKIIKMVQVKLREQG